jgi:hypothetical protein
MQNLQGATVISMVNRVPFILSPSAYRNTTVSWKRLCIRDKGTHAAGRSYVLQWQCAYSL